MTAKSWNWKQKSGESGGLLYESGNWGDVLKMLWLAEIIRWKEANGAAVTYVDAFAGDTHYPLGDRMAFRIRRCGLAELEFIEEKFLSRNLWPSAAAGAALLASGGVTVWDADEGRRNSWREIGADVAKDPSSEKGGYAILAEQAADAAAVLMADPYDFLAEWREELPGLVAKSRECSVLLYLYNRSARTREAFAEYRRFRGRLDNLAGDCPKRIGRIAADGFLPNSHHEMVFLPGEADRARPGFQELLDRLGDITHQLNQAQQRLAVFDC